MQADVGVSLELVALFLNLGQLLTQHMIEARLPPSAVIVRTPW